MLVDVHLFQAIIQKREWLLGEWRTSLRVSGVLFARYTFFPQVDKLPKLPPEFGSYRLIPPPPPQLLHKVYLHRAGSNEVLPMLKIYRWFPVFVLRVLFNDVIN
jgi:hypothetical protein